MQIAFIGLGNMGSGMAANLVNAGHTVIAFDLSAEALARAATQGCVVAASAGEAVAAAEAVITMLPAGAHVRRVYAESILPNVKARALVVDCSTVDVDSARAVAALARDAGLRAADAPVSGGTAGAEAGALAFMVGCADADFTAVQALVQPMAKTVIHAGGAGTGQAAKICNNMLLGIGMLGTCEAFVLAEKLGLDTARFFQIASTSSGQCWSLTSYCPVPGPVPTAPSNRDFVGGFAAAMMLKDLKLAQQAAAAAGAATPLGSEAQAIYQLFNSLGHAGKDFSAIIEMLRGQGAPPF